MVCVELAELAKVLDTDGDPVKVTLEEEVDVPATVGLALSDDDGDVEPELDPVLTLVLVLVIEKELVDVGLGGTVDEAVQDNEPGGVSVDV